jgi:hypothetical protein
MLPCGAVGVFSILHTHCFLAVNGSTVCYLKKVTGSPISSGEV